MSFTFFDETSESVDFVKGGDLNHYHYKEKIVFLEHSYFLAQLTTEIQRGDLMYRNGIEFIIGDLKAFQDFKMFKIKA